MKNSIAFIAAAFVVALTLHAQSPTPSPKPVTDIFAGALAAPTPAAAPATPQELAARQKQFHQQASFALQNSARQILRLYEQSLSVFADGNGLTAQQKADALSEAEQTRAVTVAWQLYNVLKTIDADAKIPQPPKALQ